MRAGLRRPPLRVEDRGESREDRTSRRTPASPAAAARRSGSPAVRGVNGTPSACQTSAGDLGTHATRSARVGAGACGFSFSASPRRMASLEGIRVTVPISHLLRCSPSLGLRAVSRSTASRSDAVSHSPRIDATVLGTKSSPYARNPANGCPVSLPPMASRPPVRHEPHFLVVHPSTGAP